MKKLSILFSLCLSGMFSLQAQTWLTDIEEAKTAAEEQNRNIVLAFQGSDWCAPCIKLDKKIWSSEAFKTYSADNFVLVKADFPRRKKNKLGQEQQEKNNKLFEQYNKQGSFPLVVVMNHKGEVLGQAGYNKMKPAEYINLLASY